MEIDDDTFIVIVGDENEDSPFPAPIEIKQEKHDEEEMKQVMEELLQEPHNEIVTNFDLTIKKEEVIDECDQYNNEHENNYQYLPCEKTEVFSDDDQEYVPEEMSLDTLYYSSSEDTKIATKRKRVKMPSGRISYVKELKSEYPELRDDNTLLITCLAAIMKSKKAPPPPQDYYIMNGIMLECVYCGYQSQSIPAASRHFQEKHGERYLFCYACGVNFRSATNLYKHEKRCSAPDVTTVLKARAQSLGKKGRSRPYIPEIIDEGPKRFPCAECSATFSSKYTLHAHQRLHRGERPHRCPHCAAAYTSRTALARHKKKHSEEQYICDHCQRSFKLKPALVTHMDTHRPMKKFGCELCPKRYSQKAALLLHVNKVHKNLPPPCACQICPKRYPRMSLLKEHMKKVHGLVIMTRKMFFKKMPLMSDTQVKQAKVVFKSEVEDPHYDITNFKV